MTMMQKAMAGINLVMAFLLYRKMRFKVKKNYVFGSLCSGIPGL